MGLKKILKELTTKPNCPVILEKSLVVEVYRIESVLNEYYRDALRYGKLVFTGEFVSAKNGRITILKDDGSVDTWGESHVRFLREGMKPGEWENTIVENGKREKDIRCPECGGVLSMLKETSLLDDYLRKWKYFCTEYCGWESLAIIMPQPSLRLIEKKFQDMVINEETEHEVKYQID